MIKKTPYLAAILFGAVLFAAQASAITVSNCGIFKDVSATDKNCPAIKYVYERGIFSGYNVSKFTDGTAEFKPNQGIIRAEVLKVAVEAFTILDLDPKDQLITGDTFPFSDLKGWTNQWWFKYLKYATSKQIINGYKDGTFKPLSNVTRAEFLKIFLAASPKIAEVNALEIDGYNGLWADTAPTDWFAKYIIYANRHGLFGDLGYCQSGHICPNKDITRAEVAQLIYNYHLNLKADVGRPLLK
jgi:hypothetical protein